jgi:hypothetical protein
VVKVEAQELAQQIRLGEMPTQNCAIVDGEARFHFA